MLDAKFSRCLLDVYLHSFLFSFFFFNDTATTEIYTLSLHDALPISTRAGAFRTGPRLRAPSHRWRSEEHTSELQSRGHLVCRLLLEKKKNKTIHALHEHPTIDPVVSRSAPTTT